MPPRGEPAARFTLPICPSVNNLFVNLSPSRPGSNGRARSAEYKRWAANAGWTIRGQGARAVHGPVAVLVEAPLSRRRDLDNALKPVLDLLVSLALIDDDNLVDDLRIVRVIGDLMTVSIWAMRGVDGESRCCAVWG